MTQKDKEFLLKDLSGRLPYRVRVNYKENNQDIHHWYISTLYALEYSQSGILINLDHDGWIDYKEYIGCGMSSGSCPLHLDKMLPYLRSISSMTDKEREEYDDLLMDMDDAMENIDRVPSSCANLIRFYNSHYLDYQGLLDHNLALPAPEGMYKFD